MTHVATKADSDRIVEDNLPKEVGLLDPAGVEIDAEWYARQPWAFEVTWVARTSKPWGGGSWNLGWFVEFDRDGKELNRRKLRVTLYGPGQKPFGRLTRKQKAFRKARGMSLDVIDDPHLGMSLTITFDIKVEQ